MRTQHITRTEMRSRRSAALRTPYGIRASAFVGVGDVDLSQISGTSGAAAALDLGIVLKEGET